MAWSETFGGWLVTRRADALAVLRDAETFTVDDPRFATARVVGPSMLSLEGAEHARHRAPFAGRFRRDAVLAELGPLVRREADALIAAFREEVELRAAFAGPLAAKMMAHVLGIGATPTADVLRWYGAIVAATTAASEGREAEPAGRAAFEELAAAMALEVPGLSAAEAASNAGVLLFGGIETTEGMLCNAVWHLLTNPEALAAVRDEPALLVGAVEESLRLEPAAAIVDRYATRAVGAARAGDKVVVSIRDANRDPDAFEDPLAFDPRRANSHRHLTFAAGPHVCLGMHLARLEAHTALEQLLARDLTLARPTSPEGLVFRKPPELWVTVSG
jgi:cytochrome P450